MENFLGNSGLVPVNGPDGVAYVTPDQKAQWDAYQANTNAQNAARYKANANAFASQNGYSTQLDQATMDGFNNWYADQIRASMEGRDFAGMDNYAGLKPGALRYNGSRNYFAETIAPKYTSGGRERSTESDEDYSARMTAEQQRYRADPQKYIDEQLAKVTQINVGRDNNKHLIYDRASGQLVDMSTHDTAQEGLNAAMPILVGGALMGGLAAFGPGSVGFGAAGSAAGGAGGLLGGDVAAAAGGDVAAGSATKAALYGAEGYGAGATAAEMAAYPATVAAASSSGGGLLGDLLKNSGGLISKLSSGNAGIGDYLAAGGLLNDLLGGGGTDKNGGAGTTTDSKTPWGPAQGYILRGLQDTATLNDKYKANPMSDDMKKYYGNQFAAVDNYQNNVLPSFMGFAQNGMAGGFQRGGSTVPGSYTPQNFFQPKV